MTAAEKAAKRAAYEDAIEALRFHGSICVSADNLMMDMETTLRRKLNALEARPVQQPAPRRGKADG